MSTSPTSTPISREAQEGIFAKDWRTRYRWASLDKFVPTPEQVERGLTDGKIDVRRLWAKRSDFIPTEAQAERGLTWLDWEIRRIWEERDDFFLSMEALTRVIQTRSEREQGALPIPQEYALRKAAECHLLLRMARDTNSAEASPPDPHRRMVL